MSTACRLFCHLPLALLCFAPSASAQSISSGTATLSFASQGSGRYGILLSDNARGAATASSDQPARIFVCGPCADESTDQTALSAPYSTIKEGNERSILAVATVSSPNGSAFEISDLFRSIDHGFSLSRTVRVVRAGSADVGFNSQFTLGFSAPKPLSTYHLLAPGIWYDKNANVIPGAFGTNLANDYFYWRETRSGLPFIMLQDDTTGTAISLAHLANTPDTAPRSNANESSQAWIVDPSVQYGSIGAQQVPATALGFIYPADEGDGNYVGNRSTRWVRRSHPVQQGFTHSYTLALHMSDATNNTGSADFAKALKHTWRYFYTLFNPAIVPVPAEAVYNDGIALLSHYSANRNGAQGLPFSSVLPTGDVPASQISYQMGFVGEQLPIGYQLLREGFSSGNKDLLNQGFATVDFWAHRASSASGLPLTWYNVTSPTFRDDNCSFPIFLRTASDGMEGALSAAQLLRQRRTPQPAWEHFVTAYGEWLVTHQNADGSFYRAFNPDGSVFDNAATGCDRNGFGTSKFNTTHPVRFLVDLYFASGDTRYLKAAKAAGEYAYIHTTEANAYVGGTPDNGNTVDKEAGAEALHAFLALYDATGNRKWLRAAEAAADFVETWMYAWTFPLAGASPAYAYAGTRGSSLIATGQSGADIFLAFEAYNFYRLHLFRDNADDHYLNVAQFLVNNTKLTTQVTGISQQQFGYTYDGLVGEATDFSFLRYLGGNSTTSWLPWLTEAEIEPLEQLAQAFGSPSITAIEQQPLQKRLRENESTHPAPGSIGWGTGLQLANPGFELPGQSTNLIPGWQIYTPDNGQSATAAFTESFGDSHRGKWHLAEFKPTPYTLSTYQDLVVPHGDYDVKAWVECSGARRMRTWKSITTWSQTSSPK